MRNSSIRYWMFFLPSVLSFAMVFSGQEGLHFVHKNNGMIRISYDNGKEDSFRTWTDKTLYEDPGPLYGVVTFYRDLNAFILVKCGVEWSRHYWVDKASGERTEIGRKTILSPDRSRIASFTAEDMGDGVYIAGVWRVRKGEISTEYLREGGDPTVVDMKWLDNKSIQAEFITFKNSKLEKGSGVLKKTDKKWVSDQNLESGPNRVGESPTVK